MKILTGRLWIAATALAVVAVAAQATFAQPEDGQRRRGGRERSAGGIGGPGFFSMARLASIDKVQDELKLSALFLTNAETVGKQH